MYNLITVSSKHFKKNQLPEQYLEEMSSNVVSHGTVQRGIGADVSSQWSNKLQASLCNVRARVRRQTVINGCH